MTGVIGFWAFRIVQVTGNLLETQEDLWLYSRCERRIKGNSDVPLMLESDWGNGTSSRYPHGMWRLASGCFRALPLA